MDPQSIRPSPAQIRTVLDDAGKRRHARHKLNVRVYVRLDQDNDGVIRDLSEYGVAVQAVAVLRIHQHVLLRFELVNPRTRVEAVGQVVWADASGQAGIQFTQIGKRSQQWLKDWLLMNLLATASYVSSASGIFRAPQAFEPSTELIFSAVPHRPIQLGASEPLGVGAQQMLQEVSEEEDSPELLLEFSWWPVPITVPTFSRVIDGLILILSALLFVGIFHAITKQVASLPESLGLGLGATVPFSILYWLMFVVHGCGTPGSRLARMAAVSSTKDGTDKQETDRFR